MIKSAICLKLLFPETLSLYIGISINGGTIALEVYIKLAIAICCKLMFQVSWLIVVIKVDVAAITVFPYIRSCGV